MDSNIETDGGNSKNPWKRKLVSDFEFSAEDINYFENLMKKRPKFDESHVNADLDIHTKRVALKIAPSVVAVLSYSGEEELFQGSGTIIEVDDHNNVTVITSANLVRRSTTEYTVDNNLADDLKVHVVVADGKAYKGEILVYDFHYNILVLRFQSSLPLRAASLAYINDSLSLRVVEKRPFELRSHSEKLVPGDSVVAFGRYFASPFDIMAAPGLLSIERCLLDCNELCQATCIITRCGEGGPLVNHSGSVIGITYYDFSAMVPFLPINIVLKWWEHYKNHGKCCHPSLGFEATNLYAADLCVIERVLRNFPEIHKGVIVEKVVSGSSAHSSGLRQEDIIHKCGDRVLESYLELLEILWGSVGDTVELVVARANQDTLIHLSMIVAEAKPEELNSWPRRD